MPAPTYSQFISDNPEFAAASASVVVQAKLAASERMLDEEAFGDMYYDAVTNYAAHLICISPYGLQMQLTSDNGETTYYKFFKEQILPRTARRGLLL